MASLSPSLLTTRLHTTAFALSHYTLYILEFKQSSDRNEDFLRVKEDEASEQHKSIMKARKSAAQEWTFEQINFVAGRCGAVVEDDFYNKLEKLNIQMYKQGKGTRFVDA